MDGALVGTCCKYGGWTLAIGILEIVGSIAKLVWCLATCFQGPTTQQRNSICVPLIVADSILRLLNILDFMMGIVLVVGLETGPPRTGDLTAWVIYKLVFVVLWGVAALVKVTIHTFQSKNRLHALAGIVGTAVYIAIQAVFMWIVDLHKAELLALARA